MADLYPAAPVDICNLALSELKINPISSMDTGVNGEICSRHYDIIRISLLRNHIWNFAKTEAQLSRSSNGTSDAFDDVYPLPDTYIRLISVGDVFVDDLTYEFDLRSIEIDGAFKKCLCMNNSGAATQDITYIRNVQEVSEFDSLFIMLFKFELAKALAPSLTAKPSIMQRIESGRLQYENAAKAVDSQERGPVRRNISKFLNARRYSHRSSSSITTTF